MKHYCICCEQNVILKLMPEYASTGIWCSNCGVGFMRPLEDFPKLPKGLVLLIEGWNFLWDLGHDKRIPINMENLDYLIKEMGIELVEQVNQYYECRLSDVL